MRSKTRRLVPRGALTPRLVHLYRPRRPSTSPTTSPVQPRGARPAHSSSSSPRHPPQADGLQRLLRPVPKLSLHGTHKSKTVRRSTQRDDLLASGPASRHARRAVAAPPLGLRHLLARRQARPRHARLARDPPPHPASCTTSRSRSPRRASSTCRRGSHPTAHPPAFTPPTTSMPRATLTRRRP